jgi:hypothetical protein
VEFIETFSFFIKYKQGKENIVTDLLTRMYVLLNTLNTRLLGFEYVKEKYPDDTDFDEIYFQCELAATNGFFRRDGFLFKYKRLYVLNCSMRELQAHNGGLI